jgi:glycosyltransferase involved in cell wall biosynthesis
MTDWLTVHSTAVSHAVAERSIRAGVVPRGKCSVVTNGIDLSAFASEQHEGSSARESMNPQNNFVWLAAGRDVPAKDFDNLLAAFKCVRMEFPRTQLWIAGQIAKERFARLEAECWERDHVRWLGLRDNMAVTMAATDAFVLSSAWEGMPLVVGEAMAMKKPVVATDVGGVRELVGDAGLIVPPEQPQALTEAMLRLMRTPLYLQRAMGRLARERIRHHFDIDAKVDQWHTLYANLLNTSHQSSTDSTSEDLVSRF